MRIVIDMQGAQNESRFRGIGRYTLAFAQAVARNRGEHEIILALSGLFPETIEPIRAAFHGLLPQENIRVWHAPGPVREEEPGNKARREAAELIREAFLASLQPDVIHICSLFEGYVDDAVTSIGRFDTSTPVSVTIYDLIPLLNGEKYLRPYPRYEEAYHRKLQYLQRAAIGLSISESSRKEAVEALNVEGSKIVNVSTAIDPHFHPSIIDDAAAGRLRTKLGIRRNFVFYTGGPDERKNLPRLIRAYASLPPSLRASHQLVFAGKMPEDYVARFRHLAHAAGLKADELVFTGYVTDEELVQLYNLCRLYVFPSWHEGFGLPALEAMACSAPVIAANTSSLPEVIGLQEALFDPFDVAAIAAKMAQGLEDENFRSTLREHGLKQAKKFSWDETAKRAFAAWEALPICDSAQCLYVDRSQSHNRLIDCLANVLLANDDKMLARLASCLAQNQSAGIERQLLLDVSELSQRDAATDVQRVVRSYLKYLLESPPPGFRVEPVYATPNEGYHYARRFTLRSLGLNATEVVDEPMQWQRGDLFFGLDMQHHVQLAHAEFYQRLRQDGVIVKFLIYDLLPIQLDKLFYDPNAKALHEQWLTMIAGTDGAVCISKATADAFEEWINRNGITTIPRFSIDWLHIGGDIEGSQPSKGLPTDAQAVLEIMQSRPTFLCVSTLEPRKRQHQILNAVELLWAEGLDVNLVFVGQQGWQMEGLVETLCNHPERGHRLFWLEGISDEYLEKVYAASTCLIAASLNEGFGLPLIEAARHGIPIIARDIPVFREVAGDSAFYFKGDAAQDLAEAIKVWLRLFQLGEHPKSTNMRWSTWRESTENLKKALVQKNYPRRQLLVDISELVQRDVHTGIQRVVRNVLKEWLHHPPEGYRVELAYATVHQPYRYARQFTAQFLGIPSDALTDEPIDVAPGDIFFALDLKPEVQTAHAVFYQYLRQQGLAVQFMVYDLLCIQQPEHFVPHVAEGFSAWLQVVGESDGAVCISKATADALAEWMQGTTWRRQRPFTIQWNHIGADLDKSAGPRGIPSDAEKILTKLCQYATFLMVGTLEPRKGHAQVLDAFEKLWQQGTEVNLVIVGKQGWMVEKLVERLRAHPELNKRLFWLEGISDEYLEKVYAASTCLIAASYGEGFGLPLIEAAQHKLPIMARDIPVFREAAGEHAYYFASRDPQGLAHSIEAWLSLYEKGKHPRSDNMPWVTWKESAARLMSIVVGAATGESR
ncbi:MAG: glycosyltransferase family 4 protein [Deltaproteobacteria bacterium]|nr:glycosyltransferase family 4 protein [Deltaproteobacteria bacterium]MBW2033121.1 glycosyltransferase family 4 protein [Deltaproteobacteria bacterium]MBW2301508.1 glycosyltransferase family 4 protein [Deltaproteobacteria bacterium]